MKGDFSRDTFDKKNHFSKVLMQQGRVTLDADYNEQTAILLHYLRTLVCDLIGPYGSPNSDEGGFKLEWDNDNDLKISKGRYYVNGILVENEDDCLYTTQKNYPLADETMRDMKKKPGEWFLVYLDVWERHITYIEQESIREKALNGADTCTRAKVVWQVNVLKGEGGNVEHVIEGNGNNGNVIAQLLKISDNMLKLLPKISSVQLAAQLAEQEEKNNPCVLPPESKYQGVENQLYRVEIHHGGTAEEATFKWSRDNGSIVTRWLRTEGNNLIVANTRGFTADSWVEILDDTTDLQVVDSNNKPRSVLVKLTNVENGILSINSNDASKLNGLTSSTAKPKVRLWNQFEHGNVMLSEGAIPIKKETDWIDLEYGVQVKFFSPQGEKNIYQPGDYWLIPARIATGDIEWPVDGNGAPIPMNPHGVQHHYAPLGFVRWDNNEFECQTCRREFSSLREESDD